VRGFGPKLQAQLLEGLKQVRTVTPQRFRIKDALLAGEALLRELRENPSVERAELTGETRRFCETVERVELLVSTRTPGPVLEGFAGSGLAFETLSRTPDSATVRLYERDLVASLSVCAPEDWATTLFMQTGSPAHVAQVLERAGSQGVTLEGKGTRLRSEAALYGALGLELVPPELREGEGELELAASASLPCLVEGPEVLGVVHSHSTWSDGNASLEEMAIAARDAGYQYLTVTEHSPTAFYAGGLSVDALERLLDEVAALNARLHGITLLTGVESDITAAGQLDYPDAILARLDVVIGSIHARHKMDEEKMTARILSAMDSPYLHILGHLTGRLIQSRPPYAIRTGEIMAKAAERGIAIEVNGSPSRLDIRASQVREALAAGVKLVLSADSHSVGEIGNLRYALGVARKGGASRADILNTLPAAQFVQTLHAMRRNAS
jgi:DNA polymerase (family 10)